MRHGPKTFQVASVGGLLTNCVAFAKVSTLNPFWKGNYNFQWLVDHLDLDLDRRSFAGRVALAVYPIFSPNERLYRESSQFIGAGKAFDLVREIDK